MCIDKRDIDARDQRGLVPAMWACYGDRLENLLLLEKISRKHRYSSVKMTQDYNGLRCSYYALRSKHGFRCLEHLLTRHRAHTLDPNGQTILHHAAVLGLLNACRIILKHTGHTLIDMVDRYNRTALHLATITGNGNIVKLLLEYQAKPDICDVQGFSPVHHARTRELHYCVYLFAKYKRLRMRQEHSKIKRLHSPSMQMIYGCNGENNVQVTNFDELLSSSSSEIIFESQEQAMREFEPSIVPEGSLNSNALSSQPRLVLRTPHVGEIYLQKRHTLDLSTGATSVTFNSKASIDNSAQCARQVSPRVNPNSRNPVNMGAPQAQTSSMNFLSTNVNLRPKSFKSERPTCRKTVSPLVQSVGAGLRSSLFQADGFKRLSTVSFPEAPVTQSVPQATTVVKNGATPDVSDIDLLDENHNSQRVVDLKTAVHSVPFHQRRELLRMRLPLGENFQTERTVNGHNISTQANRGSSCSSISEMEQEELCVIQNQRASGRSKPVSCSTQLSRWKHPQSACVKITDNSNEKSTLLKRTQVNRTLQSVKQFFKKTEKRLAGSPSAATFIKTSNNEEFVKMQQKRTNSSQNIRSCNIARLEHNQNSTVTTIPVSPFQMVRKSFLSPTLGQAASRHSLSHSIKVSLRKCARNYVNVDDSKNLG
ncbi:hypothetical protein EG68_02231 [Paragonimus skrjabini miyazakii]|uniref:Uncharacterized protein n=1 Tax=Paragonimus skrjabini miyazakii TaxID=59628 RepID=A0A8S9ZAH2_9TREM|nr:hypothetical protein EG68_02231 [Paragonimus skrjabini miyazakii]